MFVSLFSAMPQMSSALWSGTLGAIMTSLDEGLSSIRTGEAAPSH